ncbi:MAG TPA: hypothetical protein VNY73_06545 [Bacteroidia bacterium]|jgi:hypothetical protein|nr:hypothetical protein [Bacteroidia bacterium]
MKKLLQFICLSSGLTAFAQLPASDIFLANVEIKNNLVKVEKAEEITGHKGYNNQPFFMPDGKTILFSSEVNSKGKVHICSYDMKTKKTKKFTQTPTSEFSPGLTPDGISVSAVVVEEDSTQRVWYYDVNTGAKKSCVHTGTDSVGYYAWLGKDTMVYYKLGNPHSLRVLHVLTSEDYWLCDNPARSFKKIDPTTLFYIISEEKENRIYFYDLRTKKATLYATDKLETLDYVWLDDLGMVKAVQSKIYRYSPETKVWVELADLSGFGVRKITRFAFSPDKKRMAVVSNAE